MKAFELKPLLVAAAIGALALYIINSVPTPTTNVNAIPQPPNYFLWGALTGALVQIGVRLTGVS